MDNFPFLVSDFFYGNTLKIASDSIFRFCLESSALHVKIPRLFSAVKQTVLYININVKRIERKRGTCCRRWRLVANWQYADHTLRSLDICSKCSALAPSWKSTSRSDDAFKNSPKNFCCGNVSTYAKFVSDSSPERAADFQVSDNSSECPDELYNLTKLAEVAAAAGQILESRHAAGTPSNISDEEQTYTYTHKLFDKTARTPRAHIIKVIVTI